MQVFIRADASLAMGSGHLMRCLTLADQLSARGAEVAFVCREHPGNLNDLPAARGYAVARLDQAPSGYAGRPGDVAHAAWLGVTWEQDADQTIAALRGRRPQWLVVDHYALDRRWEQKLRPLVGKIMVIDDLADRPHDCDLLLDQNYYHAMQSRYERLLPGSCRTFLGPGYALLRPEFVAARQTLRPRDGRVKRVLVFFGGVDPTSETEKALEVLAGVPKRCFEVDVVVGAGHADKERVQDICLANPGFRYHCQIDNMAELMAATDLAIGAGGSATWERCCLGLPTVTIVIADNQEETTKALADIGAVYYLGRSGKVKPQLLADTIRDILNNPRDLKEVGKKAFALANGGTAAGVSAVSEAMMEVDLAQT